MPASCAACGDCCSPVVIEADVFLGCCARARSQETASHDDRFIAQHRHPLSGWTEEGSTWLEARCDAFDPQARLCTAHAGRPPVCRDFPWYGGKPAASRLPYLRCSYQADIPPGERAPGSRPLIPVTVL